MIDRNTAGFTYAKAVLNTFNEAAIEEEKNDVRLYHAQSKELHEQFDRSMGTNCKI